MKKRGLMFLFLIAPLLSGCTQFHTHTFGEWIEVEEPTCKEQGIEKRVCECGEEEFNFISKIEHTIVVDQEQLPTCEEDGKTEGQHCSTCDEIIIPQTTISKLNHIYDSNVWQYTGEDGHAHVCDECGKLEVISHTSSGEATEKNSEVCTVCGYIITPKTGHITHSSSSLWSSNKTYHWHNCSGCESIKYDLDKHNLTDYELVKEATSSQEGSEVATCEDCGYVSTLKVLKTPVITKSDAILSWNRIDNATGYRVYNGTNLVKDIGDVTSYAVGDTSLAGTPLTVQAYTTNEDYSSKSNKSNALAVDKTVINLNTNIGTDFEGYTSSTKLSSSGWKSDSSGRKVLGVQSSYETYSIVEEEGNSALKMYCNGSENLTRIGIDVNDEIKNVGMYKATIKVKLGPKADNVGNILFKFHDKAKGIMNDNRISESIYFKNTDDNVELSKTEWKTLEVEFALPNPLASNDDLFIVLIAYTNNKVVQEVDNYILFDDLKFYKTSDEVAIGTDFEGYTSSTSLSTTGWKPDAYGRSVIGIQSGYQGNKIVEENDNTAIKMYGTSNDNLTRIGIDVDNDFKNVGMYKASIKVKLGPKADNVGSILFKFHDKAKGIANANRLSESIYFKQAEDNIVLSKTEWTTLEVEFAIPSALASDSDLCIVLIAYTNNYEAKDPDNYLLIDDLEMVKTSDKVSIGSDFEGYSSSTDLSTTGWKPDAYGRSVIGIQSGYQGNKIVEENGNSVVKMYGVRNDNLTRIGIDVDNDIKNVGTYKASIDVKLGPKADNVTSILFKFHDKAKGIANANRLSESIYFKQAEDNIVLSKTEWTTLEVEFTIETALASDSDLFIVLIAYTNNYEAKDPDNYLLIDNLVMTKLS